MSRELTRELTRSEEGKTFAERIRGRLAVGRQTARSVASPSTSALLLDTSGSMDEWLGPNTRRIDELRKLAAEFPGVRQFCFGSTCEETTGKPVREPYGGTAMDVAFGIVKGAGINHIVLITDGRPDSPDRALKSAANLRIDCFYVGPDPVPAFLQDLARITGGQYNRADLSARRELTAAVRGLLPAPGIQL